MGMQGYRSQEMAMTGYTGLYRDMQGIEGLVGL